MDNNIPSNSSLSNEHNPDTRCNEENSEHDDVVTTHGSLEVCDEKLKPPSEFDDGDHAADPDNASEMPECTGSFEIDGNLKVIEVFNVDEKPVETEKFQTYRILKQTSLVCAWVCLGLYAEIIGPTIPDLKDRICANYEQIGKALSAQSFGSLVGAILGGFGHEYFHRHTDLILASAMLVAGFATLMVPWSTSVAMLGGLLCVGGISDGLLNTGANTMVLDIWGAEAASPMHSLHFGFGLGALLAPQFARPFLSPDNDTANATDDDDCMNNSQIEIPYSIIAVLIIGFSVVLFGFYIKGPPEGFPVREGNTNFKVMLSPGSCGFGHVWYGFVVFLWLAFYFMHAIGGERIYGKFLFSFATDNDDINMSKDRASTLQTWFWLSFTIGRFSGIIITKFLRLSIVITGDIIGNIIAAALLATFAVYNETALWVVTFFMAVFIAVVFPNGMIWGGFHLNMNSMGVMILYVGGSLGGMLYQYVAGYFFENFGPNSLMYLMVVYSILLLIAVLGMYMTMFCLKPTVYPIEEKDHVIMTHENLAVTGSSFTLSKI